jgi:succinylglutamic semialdehyde dehydrogenase
MKGHLINNQWLAGEGDLLESLNPASLEVIYQGTAAAKQRVHEAVASSVQAFENWSQASFDFRFSYIGKFKELLIQKKDDLAFAIAMETGKPIWEAKLETDYMVSKINISHEAYHKRTGIIEVQDKGFSYITHHKPHGVIAILGPFNFPGHLPNGHIIPALLAGNTVVFKPSEFTPLVGEKIAEIWLESGLPAGVFNLVQGGRNTGEALVSEADIAGLFFTGSFETGKILHRHFAGFPEKIIALEMGGNNPIVVHDISDYPGALYKIIVSAFITSGQRCSCARRLIVQNNSEGTKLMELLSQVGGKINVGAFNDNPEPFMGPLISAKAVQLVERAWQDLINKGGQIILPQGKLSRKGYFITPGIIDVTKVQERNDAEIFGPLLQVIRVSDFDEAIHEANNTAYGLCASLLSDNLKNFDRFYNRVRAGILNFNKETTGASSRQPFGGIGKSGNLRPSAYYAADYCAYPVASVVAPHSTSPARTFPGLNI